MTTVVICCLHTVLSFQNKDLLKMFPFLSENSRKMGNIKTGIEIVNPCIVISKAAIDLWYLALRNLFLGLVISCISPVGV